MSQLESLNLPGDNCPQCDDKPVDERGSAYAEISPECSIEDDVKPEKGAHLEEVHEELPLDHLEEMHEEPPLDHPEEATAGDLSADKEPSQERTHHVPLDDFLKTLEAQADPEVKLQCAIDFMEKSLAQPGIPHFKSFWQVRNICLELFKDNIQPVARTGLWVKYSELSKEARRLKELLDEQSAFAVEQIEIAIQALEGEIAQLSQPHEVEASGTMALSSKALEPHASFYRETQFELDLLNKQASRINALRKELVKTEMRVRKKNQFFQRLSIAGDKVFPRRKELIKEISGKFISDVDAFIATYFSQDHVQDSIYFLREEIKSLQSMAKLLTLNTHAFTHTRMKLSECWDKIRLFEKELKKMRTQQKAAFKQNVDAVLAKIAAFTLDLQSEGRSLADAHKQFDEIVAFMRSVELGRDEVKYLREQLNIARQPLLDRVKNEEQLRLEQEQGRARAKQQKILDLKQEVELLLQSGDACDADSLILKRDILLNKIQETPLVKAEKMELERLLKPLRDIISDKQDDALMALSDDDRQALQQLQEVLKQRKERRQEIKDQIESLRKTSGSSGLGFEQAMECNAQLKKAKEQLEKMNQAVREIENKIAGRG